MNLKYILIFSRNIFRESTYGVKINIHKRPMWNILKVHAVNSLLSIFLIVYSPPRWYENTKFCNNLSLNLQCYSPINVLYRVNITENLILYNFAHDFLIFQHHINFENNKIKNFHILKVDSENKLKSIKISVL